MPPNPQSSQGIESALLAIAQSVNEKYSRSIFVGAYRLAAQSISAFTKLTLDVVEFNIGDFYNPANGRFTCAVPGLYIFNGTIAFSPSSSGQLLLACLYKNGTEYKRGDQVTSANTNQHNLSVGATVYLNPGDYIEYYAYGSGSLFVGQSNTYLSVTYKPL